MSDKHLSPGQDKAEHQKERQKCPNHHYSPEDLGNYLPRLSKATFRHQTYELTSTPPPSPVTMSSGTNLTLEIVSANGRWA